MYDGHPQLVIYKVCVILVCKCVGYVLIVLCIPLTVQIMAGRHLVKQGRGIASPYVEIEIAGMDCDNQKFKTSPHGSSRYNTNFLHLTILVLKQVLPAQIILKFDSKPIGCNLSEYLGIGYLQLLSIWSVRALEL